jgi:predicted nucleic acid-binding protein
MDEDLILETTFLIDLERERHRGEGPAFRFLRSRPESRLFLTPTIRGELAGGLTLSKREDWLSFVEPFHVLPINQDAEWCYGETFRLLRKRGILIGGNDLWIAAVCLARSMTLVSANLRHFGRVPNLRVLGYR